MSLGLVAFRLRPRVLLRREAHEEPLEDASVPCPRANQVIVGRSNSIQHSRPIDWPAPDRRLCELELAMRHPYPCCLGTHATLHAVLECDELPHLPGDHGDEPVGCLARVKHSVCHSERAVRVTANDRICEIPDGGFGHEATDSLDILDANLPLPADECDHLAQEEARKIQSAAST